MGRVANRTSVDRNFPRPEVGAEGLRRSRESSRDLSRRAPVDEHLERISFILDQAIRIPGTNIRFGLDPIISLLFPVAGDTIASLVSAYIVLVSVRHGLPKGVIARMVFNIAADFTIGSLPVVGDLFDFAWKSNKKNMQLLNRYASGTGRSSWGDWAWLLVLLGGLALLIFGLLALVIYALKTTDFSLI